MKAHLVVMSDSHGYDEAVEQILKENPAADAYIHCGDLSSPDDLFPQLLLVKGNNDYYTKAPYERVLLLGGMRIYLCHSHKLYGYPARHALARRAKELKCPLALYGHTHRFDDSEALGVRLVNPGSCWYNRDMSDPCYAVVDIEDGKIKVTRKTLQMR
ncbi:MAG: metallophosphoesterase [Erysipelotrichales bacterium]|nr:metallophosphoesterase [Erysipelotrichales bacterium]